MRVSKRNCCFVKNPWRGILTKIVCQRSIWGDALGLKFEPLTCLKVFWLSLKKLYVDSRTGPFRESAITDRPQRPFVTVEARWIQKMRENTRCYYIHGPPQKQFSVGPGKVLPRIYFDGANGWGVTALRGTLRNFLKARGVLSLGLMHVLMHILAVLVKMSL
jgi:hypothetical protein